MRRATTATLKIDIDESLVGMWYRVALEQRGTGTLLIKDEGDCELSEDGKTITVRLTQEETLRFSDKCVARVQVRFGDGTSVAATNIASVDIYETIDEEVIT